MSTPSRFKKDKEIIAEYESQVKGKDGSGRPAPFVCVLVIVLPGSCICNLGSALEGGCGGTGRAPAQATVGFVVQDNPGPNLSPVKPTGAGDLVAPHTTLPPPPARTSQMGFNLTTAFSWATYRGGGQHQ